MTDRAARAFRTVPLDMLTSRTISLSDEIKIPGPYSPLVIRSSRIASNRRQAGAVTAAPDSGPPTARAARGAGGGATR